VALRRSASFATLKLRARILSDVRAYFDARGLLEVETPALSTAGTPDLALESVATEIRAIPVRRHYLQTSPEYPMKRLLAAGSGDIFQICRVFRDDELGRWHQPEFTLLEWYRLGWSEIELMSEVEDLLTVLLGGRGTPLPSSRTTYRQAFRHTLGIDPLVGGTQLAARLSRSGIDVPPDLTADALMDLALATLIVPEFPRDTLTFIYDYPASQAALAEIRLETPPVAARFEVFLGGVELANGFRELTDPAEQRRRFERELDARRRAGRVTPPLDEEFLAALAALPPCAGVALGIDRLVAFAADVDNIAEAITFAHEP
jgi:lysyl-tRNA synthetase class 2